MQHLFKFLKKVTMLNNKALYIQYDSGISSFDILYEGSKNLPRKTKKKLRKYILI